jgi:hypothetical protein
MDQRHRKLLGPFADDADVRGEHRYPDGDGKRKAESRVQEQLNAREGSYVAGADGTQVISEPDSEISEVECPDESER